jgi:hypothetical protein
MPKELTYSPVAALAIARGAAAGAEVLTTQSWSRERRSSRPWRDEINKQKADQKNP